MGSIPISKALGSTVIVGVVGYCESFSLLSELLVPLLLSRLLPLLSFILPLYGAGAVWIVCQLVKRILSC